MPNKYLLNSKYLLAKYLNPCIIITVVRSVSGWWHQHYSQIYNVSQTYL